MHDVLMMAILLLGAHWLADYPLQGQFLSDAKVQGPLRFYHLTAHAGIHGAAVALVTGNVWLGIAEWIVHTIIDELKVKGWTNFALDQALHIACMQGDVAPDRRRVGRLTSGGAP